VQKSGISVKKSAAEKARRALYRRDRLAMSALGPDAQIDLTRSKKDGL
jgi:hypothetical protein